MDQNYTYISI